MPVGKRRRYAPYAGSYHSLSRSLICRGRCMRGAAGDMVLARCGKTVVSWGDMSTSGPTIYISAISYQLYHISYAMSAMPCQLYHISYATSAIHISCIMSAASCQLCHVSYAVPAISYQLFIPAVSCQLCHVSYIIPAISSVCSYGLQVAPEILWMTKAEMADHFDRQLGALVRTSCWASCQSSTVALFPQHHASLVPWPCFRGIMPV